MPERNEVVAVYATHTGAEEAVKTLQRAGIDMRTLSIVSADSHTSEHVVGYYNCVDRIKDWGKIGALLGGLCGLLLEAGPLTERIVRALERAAVAGSLSAIGAGLYGWNIPRDSILRYEMAVKTHRFLLLVHGTDQEVEHARALIESTQAVSVTPAMAGATTAA